jgi:protease I
VDIPLDAANPDNFDALLMPGGVMNPDLLRVNEKALEFVRAFFDAGKPVAAICHAPWTLIDAGVVSGRRMTSYRSIRTDLVNAGADWVNEPVVVDRGLTTSRQPSDIPEFNDKMIEEFAEGVHAPTAT